jgi:hypothetical protein
MAHLIVSKDNFYSFANEGLLQIKLFFLPDNSVKKINLVYSDFNLKKLLMFRFSFFIFLFISCSATFAQQNRQAIKTVALFDSIRNNVPREKIYIHLDKSIYLQSDTLWFKAYLVSATENNPSGLSGLIYTEMIDANGDVVESMSLPAVLGLSWGSFALNSVKYKLGDYTFRAYTNWMQNFGSTYFFKKNIKILSLIKENPADDKTKTTSIKIKKIDSPLKKGTQDIDIQFLPEGGKLIVDAAQKIAFKALSPNGKGIKISGEIINAKQAKVAEFKSNDKGMGYFNLTPVSEETYTASVRYGNFTKNIALPKPQSVGTIIKVVNNYASDSLKIILLSNSETEQNLTILGQSRGTVYFTVKIKLNDTKVVKVAKNLFPTGVCQIILLDEKEKIINERNMFIDHNDELKLEINSANTIYGIRDSIPVQLKVVNATGNPVEGSFSIAVTDDNQVSKDAGNDVNILSYLLLSSDLKGEIENPGYYFDRPNEQKHDDLEALMLTQGWVSYDWDLTKKPSFKAEKEYLISGKVSNVMNKPLAKAKITLFGTNRGFTMMMDTVTNANGEFIFNQLPRLDSASFVIQAKNEKGRTGTAGITMDEFRPPIVPISPPKKLMLMEQQLDSISKNLIATKTEEYKLTSREGLLLNEVNIVGKRIINGSQNLNGAGEADLIITEDDLARIPKKTLYDVLVQKIKGFRVGIKKGTLQRIFFIHFNELKLVIDGMEVDFFKPEGGGPNGYYQYIKSLLDYYNAEDIKGIEVMENPGFSSSYKFKFLDITDQFAEFSFLEITTKSGKGPFLKKPANMYLYKPINYGDNKAFYNPKYTSTNKNDKTPDFRSTLYWHPNLITDKSGTVNTSFFSADKKGSYTVWVEGTDLQGNFGFKTMKLLIK